MGEVDPAFIQALEHRPKPDPIEADNVPLIDLSPLNSLESLVAEIREACEKWGFFQVINHGVPFRFREKIESVYREFFALPKEEKNKVARDEVNPTGYYDTEHTKNVRDWKEVFDFTIQVPTLIPATHEPGDQELKEMINHWPHNPAEMREVCEVYAAETSFMRLNHYPACPAPQLALGLGRHKDAGAMTILAQDEIGGLEVKRKLDGEWVFVKPITDAYIVNVGDLIQVWSNDKYESVEHRVTVNSHKERFSIPFFINPSHSVWVEPLKEMINEQNPAKYKGYSWGKFYATRKLSNFKKLTSENIQVHHFKL
ncbi:thebaine 6-o-demethylase [Phtheirospermum japonicum]|uniref:Thebaine 6-o-demethylase n=1 Tax=Phtheirospermum japonicum TaxID=374723 RepID=A0A830DC11_9LAMI|nr:thebaine 6-o-demethylase [Phtheirospermum japonicum]